MEDPAHLGEVEETEKINVVPLADLTLVLLIILMVLSPMISQSMIHVATPSLKAEKPLEQKPEDEKKPPAPLMISISSKGYFLNNVRAEDLNQLMTALAARLAEDAERPVLVTAENTSTVGQVVEVLDLAKQHGAQKVSLLKKTEEPAAPAKAGKS